MPRYRGQPIQYRRRGVLRLRLRQLLAARDLSPYALAKFTGLSLNTIYRLTKPDGRFRLIRAATIEQLCGALRVTPSELFEYVKPSSQAGGSGAPGEPSKRAGRRVARRRQR